MEQLRHEGYSPTPWVPLSLLLAGVTAFIAMPALLCSGASETPVLWGSVALVLGSVPVGMVLRRFFSQIELTLRATTLDIREGLRHERIELADLKRARLRETGLWTIGENDTRTHAIELTATSGTKRVVQLDGPAAPEVMEFVDRLDALIVGVMASAEDRPEALQRLKALQPAARHRSDRETH